QQPRIESFAQFKDPRAVEMMKRSCTDARPVVNRHLCVSRPWWGRASLHSILHRRRVERSWFQVGAGILRLIRPVSTCELSLPELPPGLTLLLPAQELGEVEDLAQALLRQA